MTGLDKILDQIKADSDALASELNQECQDKVSEIIKNAEQEGKAQAEIILSKADNDCKAIDERAKSSSELKISNALLSAKRSAISKTLSASIQQIKQLPDSEYFELIIKMIKKYHNGSSCELRFGSRDLSRLPKNFADELAKLDSSVKLSDVPANIDSGFILIYGMIEENCSFDAIFSELSEQLTDEAAAILFS